MKTINYRINFTVDGTSGQWEVTGLCYDPAKDRWNQMFVVFDSNFERAMESVRRVMDARINF